MNEELQGRGPFVELLKVVEGNDPKPVRNELGYVSHPT